MPNNPPAPEKAPTGYVLVTEGVVQEGYWIQLRGTGEWIPAHSHTFGSPINLYQAVLRPPTPQPSERLMPRSIPGDLNEEAAFYQSGWQAGFEEGRKQPSEREFSSRSEERRVMATLKETREINRQLIEVLRKIILKAPAWGPLWYGSEEMKAARKIINPEESR